MDDVRGAHTPSLESKQNPLEDAGMFFMVHNLAFRWPKTFMFHGCFGGPWMSCKTESSKSKLPKIARSTAIN